MSSYKNIIILPLLLIGCAMKSPEQYKKEDRLILQALEAERVGDYNNSIHYLDELYSNTNNIEYKIKQLYVLNQLKKFQDVKVGATTLLKERNLDNEDFTNIYKLLVISHINTNDYPKALEYAKELFKYDDDLETIYSLSLMQKDYDSAIEFLLMAYDNSKAEMEKIVNTLYLYLSDILNNRVENKTFDDVLTLANRLLQREKSGKVYELLYTIFILKKDYNKALEYADLKYKIDNDEETLEKIVNLLYIYLNNSASAISYLESHSRLNGCGTNVCNKLVSFYTDSLDIDNVINTYKRIYKNMDEKFYTEKIIELFIYNKKIPAAIKFLESNHYDDELLFELYKINMQFQQAKNLADEIYTKKKDINFLAQSAMLEYELNQNKDRAFLDKISEKLKYVNQLTDNEVYQNYLGYLLIDHNIDVKEGVELVKKALKKSPDSPYYLDSLAWGYHKLNRCKEALVTIQKVVDMIGLKEQEVIEHFNAIKQCKVK